MRNRVENRIRTQVSFCLRKSFFASSEALALAREHLRRLTSAPLVKNPRESGTASDQRASSRPCFTAEAWQFARPYIPCNLERCCVIKFVRSRLQPTQIFQRSVGECADWPGAASNKIMRAEQKTNVYAVRKGMIKPVQGPARALAHTRCGPRAFTWIVHH